ncbi:UDP-glucose/GDP-mannose dehydrogenase family protein [Psychrobacillus sp. PGGUH221]|uniref:UDP-glucose dehydrogenase family protein n=1 Tax=Psychrobacillus sp. PGGUH221 TaxID=3020058 RepID=UPI0035C67BC8
MENVAVIGTGYVGLVTGVVLSEIGHTVTCIDIDENKVNTLSQGNSPIYEPDLDALLEKNIAENRLHFTTNHSEAFDQAEIIFIAVGTPQSENGSANLVHIEQAARDIAHKVVRDTIVVVKSTVPVGTNDLVQAIIEQELRASVNVQVVSNPEFLREGHAIYDTFHADRIVIGAENERAGDTIQSLFENLEVPVVRTNRRSAEMIKYASNAFLAVKISYINQIANLCEMLGAEVNDVADGMGLDHRIGRSFLNAGLGYGGSCFPKDTAALAYLGCENGISLSIVDAAIHANHQQSQIFLERVLNHFNGDMIGKKIAILGLAFKPDTDDMREAPSLKIIKNLLDSKAQVKVYDPVVHEINDFSHPSIEYTNSVQDCITNADAILLVTEWDEIVNSDWKQLIDYPKSPLILDGRNVLSIKELTNLGWQIEGIGQAAKPVQKKVLPIGQNGI